MGCFDSLYGVGRFQLTASFKDLWVSGDSNRAVSTPNHWGISLASYTVFETGFSSIVYLGLIHVSSHCWVVFHPVGISVFNPPVDIL